MTRRIDAGPLLVLAGATLLLISLFLAWYEDLTAWDMFEVLDLLLAAAAIAAILVALGMLADFPAAPDARLLPWLAGAALVLVLATVLDRPPAIGEEGERDTGLWLALAGSALMALGALLSFARVSIAFDVAARERRQRVEAVDAREPAAAAPAQAGSTPLFAEEKTRKKKGDEPTEPLPPSTEKPPKS